MSKTNVSMKWKEEGSDNPLNINSALWESALDAFSSNSFAQASLNDIIKAAKMNKGSFYYRFYDKMDLYLSLFQKLIIEKLAMFQQYDNSNIEDDFYESIKKKAMLGILFARKEPRYNALSRRFLTEEPHFRKTVLNFFGDVTENVLLCMVQDGQKKGRIRCDISAQMIAEVFGILLDRVDKVITPDMNDDEIIEKMNELIMVLRDGTAKQQ